MRNNNTQKRWLSFLLTVTFLLSMVQNVYGSQIVDPASFYSVTEVVDGDTIKVNIDGEVETVRLLQVDTPESVHPNANKNVPMGKTATEFTKSFLKDKKVKLSFDEEERDKYGRMLCYVHIMNEKGKPICLNQTLVERGLAKVVKYEPNVLKYETYKKLERPVRESGIGIWRDIEGNFPSGKQKAQTTKPSSGNASAFGNSYTADTTQGVIKGNRKSMIYHVPGGASYNRISVNNVVYFNTEEEAIAAGYRKAKK